MTSIVEVTKPILSVSYLRENGVETHLARQPFSKYCERLEPLIKKAVCTSSRRGSFAKSRAQSSHAYEHEIHKTHEYEQGDAQESQKSCVRAEDSQQSCVRAEDSQN